MKSDQVHHFAAYLSAGINGAITTGSMKIHEFGDRDNPGDLKLGRAAIRLGTQLTRTRSSLREIGGRISSLICNDGRPGN